MTEELQDAGLALFSYKNESLNVDLNVLMVNELALSRSEEAQNLLQDLIDSGVMGDLINDYNITEAHLDVMHGSVTESEEVYIKAFGELSTLLLVGLVMIILGFNFGL